MQKLKNSYRHMAGKAVLVNGTTYDIDENGVAEVEDADAEKLLKGTAWRPAPSRSPVRAPEPTPPPAAAPEPPPVAPEVEEEPEEEAVEEDVEKEWPEPDASMKLGYLKDMADAYEVMYGNRVTKAELIEKIKAVMFED